MAPINFVCLLALALCLAFAHGAVRVARSPQFGGGAFSQANAQAGAGGGGFGPPRIFPQPRPPIFGRPGFGHDSGFYRPGLARPGGSISISKSVSISTGRGGGAQSSASSNAFGK